MVWFSICGAPLDTWANDGFVEVLFMYGEYGFSSKEVGPIIGNGFGFKGKIMLHCFSEVKCHQGNNRGT